MKELKTKDEINILKRSLENHKTMVSTLGREIEILQEKYKRDSEDQWTLISELNKKVEVLEKK